MNNEAKVVGPNQRPAPHPFYGDSYERGLDPWHADAFKGLEEQLGQNPGTQGERKGGWFLLDGFGNAIGWTPDGAPVDERPEHKIVVVSRDTPDTQEPERMSSKPWIWAHNEGAAEEEPRPHFHCERCGARAPVEIPTDGGSVARAAREFMEAHRDCPEPETGAPEHEP